MAIQIDIEKYFQKGDLIPAIVQEVGTGEVLMLAYMNRESMVKTIETGYTGFGAVRAKNFGIKARPRAMCSVWLK